LAFLKICLVDFKLEVNKVIHIDPVPLQVQLADGKVVNVPPPSAHGPATPIQVRLLSARRRSGMIQSSKRPDVDVPLSDSLIIHCHGGAFVALNSENYEWVLLHWAVFLDVPIISVDYSLAPEFPFPRSLQELLYVYAWALINPQLYGFTGKKIILIGKQRF
jgi:hormone-sensitive lipase